MVINQHLKKKHPSFIFKHSIHEEKINKVFTMDDTSLHSSSKSMKAFPHELNRMGAIHSPSLEDINHPKDAARRINRTSRKLT